MLARPESGPLIARRLSEYRLRLYAAPAYLERAAPLHSPEDLRRHTLIGYVPDILYSPVLDFLAEIRPGTEPDLRSSSINAQHALTVAGAGLAILPCFMGDQDSALVPVFAGEIELTRSFWLVLHKDVRQLARVAAVMDWLIDVVGTQKQLLLGKSPAVRPDQDPTAGT
jgi:DNA-binding transcriptional LysR family regulator